MLNLFSTLRTRIHKKSQLKGMKIKKFILASDLGCERKSHEAPGIVRKRLTPKSDRVTLLRRLVSFKRGSRAISPRRTPGIRRPSTHDLKTSGKDISDEEFCGAANKETVSVIHIAKPLTLIYIFVRMRSQSEMT